VERTAQLAQAISLATQQQRTASEQVVATMREIASGTRQAAAGSQQASRAADDLSSIAQDLRLVAAGFQISGEDGDEPPNPAGSSTASARLAVGNTA
jgi:methyl-accepting chemotaxis protein